MIILGFMQRNKKLIPMASLLESLIKQKGWKKQINRNRVFLIWEQVVGPEIAHHAQPRVFRGKVLWVDVSDSVWLQHLQFQKITIIEQLNKRIGAAIEDIRFNVDPALDRPLPSPEIQPSALDYQPDPGKKAEMEKLFASIEDLEVRRAIGRLWLTLDRAGSSRKQSQP